MNETAITVRISSDLKARLHAASEGLYAPSQAEIVRRGIELALIELRVVKTTVRK
jgi:predicted DNA-binding protein